MKKVTRGQLARIHVLLAQIGKKDDKEYKQYLVQQFTTQRATSTKEMYYDEAEHLIGELDKLAGDGSDRMRKKIISRARSMGWEVNGKADIDRINKWCVNRGHLHKPLNDYTYAELPKLVTQMEIFYKSKR